MTPFCHRIYQAGSLRALALRPQNLCFSARPNGYSEIITKEILSRYSSGEALTKICRDEHLPERTSIYRWRTQCPEFGEAYQYAQEEHADALIDEASEIVDAATNFQVGKLRADHRRWRASKLCRARYGNQLDVNHNGAMDIAPALLAATERLKALGVTVIDAPAKQLEGTEGPDKDTT